MSELRGLLWRTLDAAGMLIDDQHFDQTRREAAAASRRHFSGAVHPSGGRDLAPIAGSVGFSRGAMARVFGHGWQQAAGFAALAAVRPRRVATVARLGALFNLGVVLCDHLLDGFPERRATLFAHLPPELLASAPATAPGRSGDMGVDFVVALAIEVVSGARRLGGLPEDLDRLTRLLDRMYRAEWASIETLRTAAPRPSAVWEVLSAKGTLPSAALAVLALLGNPAAGGATRTAVDTAARLVGEALWIVDDLADVASDWDAGCWSRPLLLLLDRPGDPPVSGDHAVRLLLESGIAAAEAQRLADVLTELGALAGASHRALLRPVQAAVRSWIEEIPS